MDFLYRLDSLALRIMSKIRLSFPDNEESFICRRSSILRFVNRFSKRNDYLENCSDSQIECKKSRIIWIFWAQGFNAMPNLVKSCYQSVIRNSNGFTVCLVDMSNVGEYVSLPDYIFEKLNKGYITYTHFSDILRFALLSKWGGLYLDATIFVSSPIPHFDSLFTIKEKDNPQYASRGKWTGFLWYLPSNSSFAKYVISFLLVYWKKYNSLIDYFLVDYVIRSYYESNETFRNTIDSLEYSNPNLYFLQSPSCDEPYDKVQWQYISATTRFFKTSWKQKRKRAKEEPSYYEVVLDLENS